MGGIINRPCGAVEKGLHCHTELVSWSHNMPISLDAELIYYCLKAVVNQFAGQQGNTRDSEATEGGQDTG